VERALLEPPEVRAEMERLTPEAVMARTDLLVELVVMAALVESVARPEAVAAAERQEQ
jgi:hypothetical protein